MASMYRTPEDGLAFLQAARDGDLETLKSCIEKGVDIEIRPFHIQHSFEREAALFFGAGALHLAILHGHIEIVKELFRCRNDIDTVDLDFKAHEGPTTLKSAGAGGQDEMISLMLRHDLPPVRTTTTYNWGPIDWMIGWPIELFTKSHSEITKLCLSLVAKEGRPQIIMLLLKRAMARGHVPILDILVEWLLARPRPSQFLSIAIRGEHYAIVKLLLERGVRAYPPFLAGAAETGNFDLVCILLPHIANGIHLAVEKAVGGDHMQILKYLLREGHIHDHEKKLSTAIHQSPSVRITKLLLEHGFNTEATDKLGNTAIFNQRRFQAAGRMRCLLEANANANVVNGKGETPLFHPAAMIRSRGEVLDYNAVLDAKRLFGEDFDIFSGDLPPLLVTIGNSRRSVPLDLIKILLQAGADPRRRSRIGEMVIHVLLAPRRGLLLGELPSQTALYALQLFSAYGADLSAAGPFNRTVLHQAAAVADAPIVEYLLQSGVDPDAKDLDGRTPLFDAVSGAHCHFGTAADVCTQLLLKARADVHALDDYGNTLLHEAVSGRQETELPRWQILALLVDNDVDAYAKNKNWQTPMELAESRLETGLARILYQVLNGKREEADFMFEDFWDN